MANPEMHILVTDGLRTRMMETNDVVTDLAAGAPLAQSLAAAVIMKQTKTIGFADFAALTTEDTVTLDFSAALPTNARIIGHSLVSLTPFNDGTGNPDVNVEVGYSGDADAIITSYNVAHDGTAGPGTSGVAGYPMASVSAKLVQVKFTTNNAAHLVGIDAGSVTVNIFYTILA